MKTKQLLSSLCTAVYPLVSLAAVLAAALCLSSPAVAQEAAAPLAAPPLLGDAFSQDGYDDGVFLSGADQDATITPQAMRPPEFPVGCVA